MKKCFITVLLSSTMLMIAGCANNATPQIPLPDESLCRQVDDNENAKISICQYSGGDMGDIQQATVKINFKKPISKHGYDNVNAEATSFYFHCSKHTYWAKNQFLYDKNGKTIEALENHEGFKLANEPSMFLLLIDVCKERADNYLSVP